MHFLVVFLIMNDQCMNMNNLELIGLFISEGIALLSAGI